MLNLIQMIGEIGYMSFATAVAIFILIVPAGVKAWKEFVQTLGLISKKEIHEDKQEAELREIKDDMKDIHTQISGVVELIETVTTDLKSTKDENDQRRISDLRRELLDFANCLGRRERTIEECEQMFDLYSEYKVLLKRHKLKNGRTKRAMDRIYSYYTFINTGKDWDGTIIPYNDPDEEELS